MKRLFAVALVVVASSGWMGAQRGGAGGGARVGGAQSGGVHGGGVSGGAVSGGFRGGGSGHAVNGARGGGLQGGPSHPIGIGHEPGYGVGGRTNTPFGGASGHRLRGPGGPVARSVFDNRDKRETHENPGQGEGDRDGRRDERRDGFRDGYPYGYGGLGVVNYGWLDPGALLYPEEDGFYGDGYAGDPGAGTGDDPGAGNDVPQNYVEAPQGYGEAPQNDGDPSQAQGAPREQEAAQPAGPGYGQPTGERSAGPAAVDRARPGPSQETQDAVTLVFKDGRPAETIHNYALTRTTLYVTDARRREIPVADLDLAATERVNRAAGVTFHLPQVAGKTGQ